MTKQIGRYVNLGELRRAIEIAERHHVLIYRLFWFWLWMGWNVFVSAVLVALFIVYGTVPLLYIVLGLATMAFFPFIHRAMLFVYGPDEPASTSESRYTRDDSL